MISADVLQLQKRLSALGTAYSRIHAGQQLYRKSEKFWASYIDQNDSKV